MKKTLIGILVGILFSFLLVSCGSDTQSVQAKNINEIEIEEDGKEVTKGILSLKCLNRKFCLWYDTTTNIVYLWKDNVFYKMEVAFEEYGYSNYAHMPVPYYSANGLPYRYNKETNSFEMISLVDYERIEEIINSK